MQSNFDDLESDFTINFIVASMPGYVYWKDLNSVYRGCNINLAKISNLESPSDIVGKTDFDFEWGKLNADEFFEQDKYVIQTGKAHISEHDLPFENEIRSFRAEKRPLIGKSGKVIGIFGFSVDITAKKEAQKLKLENERQQIALQEKEKFAQVASKVAHDINSPLSALKMMIPLCDNLPEDQRLSLTRATERIWDIANNLLINFRQQNKKTTTSEVEPRQPLLVSDLLVWLLSEKKMQYRDQSVRFKTIISDDAQFAFIECQAIEFRRAMSNLINNAVDALKNKADGVVTVQLSTYDNAVVVEVADNGCGMPSVMKEKMRRRQSFTTGKENGYGLGLQQVWDTLEYNEGVMDVQSTPRQGTTIKIAFPMVAAAGWIAQDIHLIPHSIILILDDDESIHAAWNLRFTPLLTAYPALRLHHFTQGQEVLEFQATLNHEDKNRVVFLSDYELLHQNKNGLQIVEASAIKKATLVTSYYSNQKIREETNRLGIKILPKQMASVIPIFVN